ncbi:flagellar motor protein MotB [Nitrospira sp. Kam-Ns4a]
MARKPHHEEHENHERWLVSYADFITLLFAFFVVMYSISMINEGKFRIFSQSMKEALVPISDAPLSNRRYEIGTSESALIPAISPRMQFMRQVKAILAKTIGESEFKGRISVNEVEDGIMIAIADSLLFESGQAAVKPEALPLLAALADALGTTTQPVREIRVEGHTDNVPIRTAQFPSNWELSAGRAVAVVRLLTERFNLRPQQVSATGYAEFRPVADNLTVENRAANRRVEVTVITE